MAKNRLGKRERAAKRAYFEAKKQLEYIRLADGIKAGDILDSRTKRLLSGVNPKMSCNPKALMGHSAFNGCNVSGHGKLGKIKSSFPERFGPQMANGYAEHERELRELPVGEATKAKDAKHWKEAQQILVNLSEGSHVKKA